MIKGEDVSILNWVIIVYFVVNIIWTIVDRKDLSPKQFVLSIFFRLPTMAYCFFMIFIVGQLKRQS